MGGDVGFGRVLGPYRRRLRWIPAVGDRDHQNPLALVTYEDIWRSQPSRRSNNPLMVKRLEWLFRWATWCVVLALAILSWTPAEDMVRPGWGYHLEHVIAYLISGVIATLGYGRRRGYMTVGVLLCVYAGILEIGQNWSPGRSPAFDDFAASSMGALLGATLAWLWLTYFGRGRPTIY